jgi:hypothetical protein
MEPHASILRLYQALLALRKENAAFREKQSRAVPLNEHAILLHRSTLLVVAQLKGSAAIRLKGIHGAWQTVLTTEDQTFTTDPAPPVIDLSGSEPVIEFQRPSAVILSQ